MLENKWRIKLVFALGCFGMFIQTALAQNTIRITVFSENNSPLKGALVVLQNTENKVSLITNHLGQVSHIWSKDSLSVTVRFLGFETQKQTYKADRNLDLFISLQPKAFNLQNVVVTAQERNNNSTSVIGERAMRHLQPSSFRDLLELLPGNVSVDPSFSVANTIRLREVGNASDNYHISSQSVGFVIDELPVGTDANMQQTVGPELIIGNNAGYADDSRNTVNRGVDMRRIPTDQIQSVEIVRGLPSVAYGNASMGLVKIKRKVGASPYTARFKADGFSKLLYAGKGFELSGNTALNFGLHYLKAVQNPVNTYENYQRIKATAIMESSWDKPNVSYKIRSNIDVEWSIDDERSDPDIDLKLTDKYRSMYRGLRLGFRGEAQWENGFWRNANIQLSVNQQFDKIIQDKLIQLDKPTAIPLSYRTGIFDGLYLQPRYVSHQTVEGKPFYANAKITSNAQTHWLGLDHEVLMGAEWNMSKNFGQGAIFDPLLPPSDSAYRPRNFNDIPASHRLAAFVQNTSTLLLGNHRLEFQAGLRLESMANIGTGFKMRRKWYAAPRFSLQYHLPRFRLKNTPLVSSFGISYGTFVQFPTLNQLYPSPAFYDFERLNYYHNNPDFRRVNYHTFRIEPEMDHLNVARNKKLELQYNASFDGYGFHATWFDEDMQDGFRYGSQYQIVAFQRFDPSGIDDSILQGPPQLEGLDSQEEKRHLLYGATFNGSAVEKQGLEFVFHTKRYAQNNMRFTLSGAYLKTKYYNSLYSLRRGKRHRNIDGRPLPYIGIYPFTDGTYKERFATNLTTDVLVLPLDVLVSGSVQAVWWQNKSFRPDSQSPIAYIDIDGNTHPYTEADKNDPLLQFLSIGRDSDVSFQEQLPFAMQMNLKLSKTFYKRLRVSLFVNRLFTYDSENYNNRVDDPYFGMEMNIKL